MCMHVHIKIINIINNMIYNPSSELYNYIQRITTYNPRIFMKKP